LLTHVEDIEERKRHELALAHRASHDSLTGLPNSAELRARLGSRLCAHPPPGGRAEFLDGLGGLDGPPGADGGDGPAAPAVPAASGFPPGFDEFEGFGTLPPLAAGGVQFDHHVHTFAPNEDDAVDDGHKGLAVLFCDLDGFKSINDRFGHHAGDAVLIEVARRLTSGVRDGDTVARLGGDEFVVLADGLGRADAQDLAVRLRNAILPPIRVDGRAVRVGASFGIGWAGCGMSAEEVLHSADQRMYVEKRSRSKERRRAG
ncbi:GGDEF domain-containing protein, partial [Streptomyces sp. NPDC059850]|uniref:GGDEF domain-containing protein n=1 Tax=Streptomyces sp. NPDC059850 TaxID=3346970 RepID=UPI00365CFCEB